MIYYTLPLLLWFLFCTLRTLYSAAGLRFAHYVFALPLIFLAVFRGEIGPDTAGYIQNAQDIVWWARREPSNEIGYELLVQGLAQITTRVSLLLSSV
jgi:hypothetical protein